MRNLEFHGGIGNDAGKGSGGETDTPQAFGGFFFFFYSQLQGSVSLIGTFHLLEMA